MIPSLLLLALSSVQVIAFTPSSSIGVLTPALIRVSRTRPTGLAVATTDITMDASTSHQDDQVYQSDAAVSAIPVPNQEQRSDAKTLFDPNVQRWQRRLDTHEDPLNIHKWAGLGWLISSIAIIGSGLFYGFQEVPAILEPITYLFVLSTLAQSMSSIPMAIKYRANEPAIQRAFISAAISATSTAFTGFWLGPYGDHNYFGAHLPNLPDVGLGLVALIMLGDSLYNFNSFGDLKHIATKITEMDPMKDAKAITDEVIESIKTFPVGLPMNVAMLQQLWIHAANARVEFLDILVSRGSSSELVFYASIITSIAISFGSLTATLQHRKLVSDSVNNFANVSAVMIAAVINVIAAGVTI
jgi:hypothetical protein